MFDPMLWDHLVSEISPLPAPLHPACLHQEFKASVTSLWFAVIICSLIIFMKEASLNEEATWLLFLVCLNTVYPRI